jgi:hypothetical protein
MMRFFNHAGGNERNRKRRVLESCMNLINVLNTPNDLLALRDHLGKVLSEELSLPLKSRKLNELTAKLVGAADFNTAQAVVANKPPQPVMPDQIKIVLDISNGDNFLCSNYPVTGIIINSAEDELHYARDNEIPNVVKDVAGKEFAYWTMVPVGDAAEVEHIFANVAAEPITCPYLKGTILSDDGQHEEDFDAFPYFEKLTVAQTQEVIGKLEEEGWSGGYTCDEIAQSLRNYPKFDYVYLARVFEAIDSINDRNEREGRPRDQGFTVTINEQAVRAWLKQLQQVAGQ